MIISSDVINNIIRTTGVSEVILEKLSDNKYRCTLYFDVQAAIFKSGTNLTNTIRGCLKELMVHLFQEREEEDSIDVFVRRKIISRPHKITREKLQELIDSI